MPLIPFPNVPASPGVPAVLRNAPISSVSQLVQFELGALTELIFGPPFWGLYDADGRQVLVFDAFLGISFKQGGKISDVPTEKKTLLTTDKVIAPFETTIKLAHAGDKASRNAMLSTLDRIVRGTELYSVATPEYVYLSVNPVNYSYDRGEKNGASLLVVDLTLLEVRPKPAGEASATKESDGASKKSNGQVQPTAMGADSGRDKDGAKAREATQ